MRSTELYIIAGATAAFFLLNAQNLVFDSGWRIDRSKQAGHVRLTVNVVDQFQRSSMSNDVPLSRFEGLTAETLSGLREDIRFAYVRDAGKLLCRGHLRFGNGSGEFTFEPNTAFADEIARLGFGVPEQHALMRAFMEGLSLDFARAMNKAGVHASFDQLLMLSGRGVSPELLQAVQEAGIESVQADELASLVDQGVDARYIRDLRGAGFTPRLEEMVSLHNHGVPARSLADLRKAGLAASVEDAIQLHQQGVSMETVREMIAAGVPAEPGDLVRLHQHGIQADYVKAAAAAGYKFSTDDLVTLQNHGVSRTCCGGPAHWAMSSTPAIW